MTNKLHEIILRSYIDSDESLHEILSNPQFKRDELAKLLLEFSNFTNQKDKPASKMQILSLADEMDKKILEPNIKLIFYIAWASFFLTNENPTLAKSIIKRGLDLCTTNTPPALFSTAKTVLAYSEGQMAGFIKQLEIEIKTHEQNPHGYKRLIKRYLTIMSGQGRCYKLSKSKDIITLYKNMFSELFNYKIDFFNNLEICNFQPLSSKFTDLLIATFQYKLYFVLQNNELPNNYYEESEVSQAVLKSTCYLCNGDTQMALNILKKQSTNRINFASSNFARYALIRAELSNKNIEAAVQLMREKILSGDIHYMDDFFLARIELLLGKKERALNFMLNANINCKEFNAQNRLQIEVGLSHELKPGDLFFITQKLNDAHHPKPTSMAFSEIISSENFTGVEKVIGSSEKIREIKSNILLLSKSQFPILITGETGVGKEVIAKAIHEESPRKKEPFLAINCGAITESLLQSELFGHTTGSYTGAVNSAKGIFVEAGKGTVFLDEIGTISSSTQIALLRVLDNNEVRPVGGSKQIKFHCTIIAATNEKLKDLVEKKLFREDLYYRLTKIEISVPTLRERKSDVLPITYHFFKILRKTTPTPILTPKLEAALKNYSWPGNVRQLKNEIEKMDLFHSRKSTYDIEDCTLFNTIKEKVDQIEPTESHQTHPLPQAKQLQPWRRLKRIKQLFNEYPDLTRQEVSIKMGISLSTATSDLKKLMDENYIKKITPSKSPRSHYFILHG